MGILFHKLCYTLADPKSKRLQKQRELQKKKTSGNVKTKLKARRKSQFDSLVNEARIWMYAMSTPAEYICNNDPDIHWDLARIYGEIRRALLGRKMRKEKVARVCGRIARNILVPGLENSDDPCLGSPYYPVAPSPVEMQNFLLDKRIKAGLLLNIWDGCPDFKRDHPNVRHWGEALRVTQPPNSYTFENESLRTFLEEEMVRQTPMMLGLPTQTVKWSYRMRDEMLAQIRSKRIPRKDELRFFKDMDFIVVLPVYEEHAKGKCVMASMSPLHNILRLYPSYFSEGRHKSLRDIPVEDGMDFEVIGNCCVRFFLHEITHARSVLETCDHEFEYVPGQYDLLNLGGNLHKPPLNPTQDPVFAGGIYSAYGLDGCLALARRDTLLGHVNKAEDNADSWSYYFMLKTLVLVYPELDFMEAVRTNRMRPVTRHVRKRSTLLHHCTLFDVLRHRNAGSIRNLPGYDSSKDCFSGYDRDSLDTLEALREELHWIDKREYDPSVDEDDG